RADGLITSRRRGAPGGLAHTPAGGPSAGPPGGRPLPASSARRCRWARIAQIAPPPTATPIRPHAQPGSPSSVSDSFLVAAAAPAAAAAPGWLVLIGAVVVSVLITVLVCVGAVTVVVCGGVVTVVVFGGAVTVLVWV